MGGLIFAHIHFFHTHGEFVSSPGVMGMCASSGILVVVIHAVVDASLGSCSLRVFCK